MVASESTAQRNLSALRKRYPEYADILTLLPTSTRHSFETRGDTILCRDETGRWLHGPDDPRIAARNEADRLVRDAPELHVLLRPGLGYLAFAIDEAIQRNSSGSILLVVEDRLDLFQAALSLVDWTGTLSSPSTVLLLGKPETVLRAFFERHPKLSLLPQAIVATPEASESGECTTLSNALSAIVAKTQPSAQEELASLDALLTRRRSGRTEFRVLVAVEQLGYLAQAIAEGFRACDCDAELQAADKRVQFDVRVHERFWEMAPIAPDLILWANRPEISPFASEACRALGVANALWTMDSPPRLSLGRRDLSPMDVHVCFDPTYLPGCEPFGARRPAQLSLGTGLRPLPGSGPSDPQWPERLGPDVAFVGSLGDARVSELRASLWSEQPGYAAFLDALAKHPGDPAAAYEAETKRPYVGMPCFYVDEVRSAIRRVGVLSRMPRNALRVFGAGDWVGEGSSFASCYGGPVRYGPDLARIYFHARVNLNVFHAQCRDATNSRVYDVLAAGGFLLSEDRPVLHREFEVGRHLVTFSSPEEATDKVAYYLSHSAEREAIAREGQRHVLEHHTFAIRCRRLLDLSLPFIGRS